MNIKFRYTQRQKREMTAACYGYTEQEIAMAERQFTDEEVQNMRMIIARHDKEKVGITEFDLNNPPRKQYKHQEYPKHLYMGEQFVVCNSIEEEEELLAEGWTKLPGGAVTEEEVQEGQEEPEFSARRRGRPRLK